MSLEQQGAEPSHSLAAEPSLSTTGVTQTSPFADADLQERYRKEYIEQLKRQSCQGCGEDGFHF